MQFPSWTILAVLPAFSVIAVLSAWLTGRVRNVALKRGVLDVPTERSSHDRPVPRGGGLSIVTVVLAGTIALAFLVPLRTAWLWNLVVSGVLIVAVGLLDDLFHLKKRIRFAIHILAAVVIVLYIGRNIEIIFPKAIGLTGPVSVILVMLYVVWNINAYNFMDGIDGLAGGQAVFVGIVAGSIAFFNGNQPLGMVYYLLAASSLGFLFWNWQPAKIFMGDLCSTYIGLTLAVLGLWGKVTGTMPLTAFFILMAVFYTDPTWTVIVKTLSGDNPTKTHRDFAFHHAIRRGYSHAHVTGSILLIDVLWLSPLAVIAVILRSRYALIPVAVAYIPLLVGAIYLKAGRRLRDGLDPEDLARQNGREAPTR